jgi:serine/threonine protein kinase/tetratricopeptide (TPR) repeat protein
MMSGSTTIESGDVARSVHGGDSISAGLVLPAVGENLFHFTLRQELGRGAFARIFLAEQADLAGRLVVLKVSANESSEPQTLAQLQHTHIVPIHSVHEDAARGLRAVCMPYFGGASLSHVLRSVWAKTTRPTEGSELVDALQAVQSPPPDVVRQSLRARLHAEADPRGTPRDKLHPADLPRVAQATPLAKLRTMSYLRAATWIVAALADGLQHAHQRGVLHRDIKSSNILLGADGTPMLLDFNLARDLHSTQATAILGGTVAYMSPEHLRALAAKDPALDRQVDERSDIYSLGMVLYEFLTGRDPFNQSTKYSTLPLLIELMAVERTQSIPSLREKRSDVPWGLESIARKCLAAEPADRYQRAEHLAEDLRRFLADQPLHYTPELSQRERLHKWLRRHPRLTSSGSVATAATLLLTAVSASWVGIRDHLQQTQNQLQVAQTQERKQAYERGVQRALCLVNTIADWKDHLRLGLSACEETLGLYGVLEREDWQQQPNWQRLEPAEQQRLAEDTRELLLLLAWARARTAPGDAGALRGCLQLLDRAEAITGLRPSRALWEDRAAYLAQLGDAPAADAARDCARQVTPASARDHYLLATSFARRSRYAEAVDQLNQALQLNPRHYWSLFQRGICYQELAKMSQAAGDFGTCIGLWPEFALAYFNRGYAFDQGGQKAEAIRDYSAALERDGSLLPAYLNRGMARLELKRYDEALADFQKAAELGRDDAFLHAGRGVALEGLGHHPEADAAFQRAFARSTHESEAVQCRVQWVYGFAVSARLPAQAQAAFEGALRRDPQQPQALYGQAMLLVEQGQREAALAVIHRAIEAAPGFLEARRCRAILLARGGRVEEATQEINWCLEKEPNSGSLLYGAACVAAQWAQKSSDPLTAKLAADQALLFLEKAFVYGYGKEKAATDPDLEKIHSLPEFDRLLNKDSADGRQEHGK